MQQHRQHVTFRLRLSASPRASRRLIRGNVAVRQMSTPGSFESLVMPCSVIESGCKDSAVPLSLMQMAAAPSDTGQGLQRMITQDSIISGHRCWATAGHDHRMSVNIATQPPQLPCVQVRTFLPNRAKQIKGSMK